MLPYIWRKEKAFKSVIYITTSPCTNTWHDICHRIILCPVQNLDFIWFNCIKSRNIQCFFLLKYSITKNMQLIFTMYKNSCLVIVILYPCANCSSRLFQYHLWRVVPSGFLSQYIVCQNKRMLTTGIIR